MKFIAHYIGTSVYYRTIFADSLNDAIKIAERFTRKGFIMKGIMQCP